MSDPQALLVGEEHMMGQACRLLGHAVLDAGRDRVELLVYETGPREGARWQAVQTRWAVFVNGRPASSCIASTRRA